MRAFVITSAGMGEGKTLTALNPSPLALSDESGKKSGLVV